MTTPHDTAEPVTYGSYLAVDELLQLQRTRSRPEHPDELLFIVVHQASELWFKVLLHELDTLIGHLRRADVLSAVATMRRINALVRIVTAQLSTLFTVTPHVGEEEHVGVEEWERVDRSLVAS